MKQIARIGLDIAKSVFQLHGVDSHGKPVCKKILSRGEVLTFFVNLPSCLGGIEACAGSHYGARELIKRGHDARLMAAQFVSPYRKSGKNDANDAQAICEAVGRPNMRFVPVKSEEAQAVLAVHPARALTVSERTALINQVRGLGPAKRSRPTTDGHRGDVVLRTLLIHGTRSILRLTAGKEDKKSRWAEALKSRACNNVAAVALAAKNARIIWAMLARGTEYRVAA